MYLLSNRLKTYKLSYFVNVLICIRLVREITRREWEYTRGNTPEAPKLMDTKFKKGKKTLCPLQWQKKVLDALHEGTEAYMVGVMGDANLLAIHMSQIFELTWSSRPISPQPPALSVENPGSRQDRYSLLVGS